MGTSCIQPNILAMLRLVLYLLLQILLLETNVMLSQVHLGIAQWKSFQNKTMIYHTN